MHTKEGLPNFFLKEKSFTRTKFLKKVLNFFFELLLKYEYFKFFSKTKKKLIFRKTKVLIFFPKNKN